MYATSIVFLIAAVVSLAIGFFQDEELTLVYVSIAASALSAVFWALGVFRKRPIREATAGAPYGPDEGTRETVTAPTRPVRRPAQPAGATRPSTAKPAPAATPAPAAAKTAAKKTAAAAPSKTAAKATTKPVAAKTTAAAKPAAAKTATAKKTTAKTAATTTTAAAKPAGAKKTAASSSRSQVVAIPERGTYHRPDCRYVKGRRDTERITLATAKRRDFTACGTCKPA